MERKDRISRLVEHASNLRYQGVLEDADVAMAGGGPECGGSVVVYLKGDGNGRIEDLIHRPGGHYQHGSSIHGHAEGARGGTHDG